MLGYISLILLSSLHGDPAKKTSFDKIKILIQSHSIRKISDFVVDMRRDKELALLVARVYFLPNSKDPLNPHFFFKSAPAEIHIWHESKQERMEVTEKNPENSLIETRAVIFPHNAQSPVLFVQEPKENFDHHEDFSTVPEGDLILSASKRIDELEETLSRIKSKKSQKKSLENIERLKRELAELSCYRPPLFRGGVSLPKAEEKK